MSNEYRDYAPVKKPVRDYGYIDVQEQLRDSVLVPAPAIPPTITEVLTERGKRYGVFAGHALIVQSLKSVVASELGARHKFLAHDQQEALDMICHKMGRIINGDPDYADSWIDIAGYATLVADRLAKEPRVEGS